MNNRYLFRGKRLDNAKWIEGSLLVYPGGVMYICCPSETPDVLDKYNVDPSTVGQYTGERIAECAATDDNACLHMKKVWQDDLIAIYSIIYDDDDKPVRTHVATVQVKWDDQYQMLFAECVTGTMTSIMEECDISGLDDSQDYPFTFWLEYMDNSNSRFWEWEIIGNAHDNQNCWGGDKK